jgi:hypothetical protein
MASLASIKIHMTQHLDSRIPCHVLSYRFPFYVSGMLYLHKVCQIYFLPMSTSWLLGSRIPCHILSCRIYFCVSNKLHLHIYFNLVKIIGESIEMTLGVYWFILPTTIMQVSQDSFLEYHCKLLSSSV